MSVEYGPCTVELLMQLRNVQYTEPVEGIQEKSIWLDNIPGFSIGRDDSDEVIIVDYCE